MIYKNLIFKLNVSSRDQLFQEVSKILLSKKFILDDQKLFDELVYREKEGSTNFGEGVAIPHARSKNILKTTVVIVRLENDLIWDEISPNKVKVAIFLIVPDNATQLHLPILAKISSKLLDVQFRESLFSFKKNKIYNQLLQIQEEVNDEPSFIKKPEFTQLSTTNKELIKKNVVVQNDNKVRIVGVSSCPVGIAHTHMVASALERAAKSYGYEVKIEKQAAEGIVNGLSSDDILKADVVIIAAGKTIPMERFVGKRVFEVSLTEALKKPKEIIKQALETAKVYKMSTSSVKNSGTFFQRRKQKTKQGVMGYLMYGIGWMLPIVITGGILLAISSPFVVDHPKNFGQHLLILINNLGGLAFTLMIPVLGGFIAYAIADKIAFAPAAIISFLGNQLTTGKSQQNEFLFNWQKLSFGLPHAALGYLGAIAVGLFIGYLCLWMKSWKWPTILLPLVPIAFVPIIASIIGWVGIAFILALPVYYIQTGLNDLVKILQDHRLLLLMGIVLGAMIAVDMGGPINKIAFFLGVNSLQKSEGSIQGIIMGMDAGAIAVPPVAAFITWTILRKTMDADDAVAGKAALPLGFMGITEGAIPFAVKYPKFIIANVIGGAVAGALSGIFSITDMAAHGGVIVYILGAIGKSSSSGATTNYLYGLLHIVSILIGACVTTGFSVLFYLLDQRKQNKNKPSLESPLSYSLAENANRL